MRNNKSHINYTLQFEPTCADNNSTQLNAALSLTRERKEKFMALLLSIPHLYQ